MVPWVTELLLYLYNAFRVYFVDVFFQKLYMMHLPPKVEAVMGPAKGLNIIVTGPTSGIGTETAASLYRGGANVVLACRSQARGDALKQRLETENASVPDKGSLRVELLDLNSLGSVRKFAQRWALLGKKCDVLINNAGIFSMGAARAETEEGFESHIGTNHLAPFMLSMFMLVHMTPKTGRIVTVASMLHHVGHLHTEDLHLAKPGAYNSEKAYAQSKLANILMTRELRKRMPVDLGVCALAVHPGEVLTGVVRSLPPIVQAAYRLVMGMILLSPAQGARASLYAATALEAPKEAEATGGYINSNCQAVQPSAEGSDDKLSASLWEWSQAQVKLPAMYYLNPVETTDVSVEERKQQ